MPIKFSGTKEDLPNIPDQTIHGNKTFSETIIGDIRSNNTSYFTDICVNQISTPDIAGQVLTIDCSLNVKGNISYKDAGGSQQDLLAIIADLSSRYHDLKNYYNGLPGEVLSDATEILNLINNNADIEAKYIQVGYDNLSSGTSYSQTGRGSIQCKNFYIAEELIGPGGWTDNNKPTFSDTPQGIKLDSGFYGLFYNNGISHWGSTTTSTYDYYVKTSGINSSSGPSYPIMNYYVPQGSED